MRKCSLQIWRRQFCDTYKARNFQQWKNRNAFPPSPRSSFLYSARTIQSRHRLLRKMPNPPKPKTLGSTSSHLPFSEMDLTDLAKRLGLAESKHVVRRAAELRRMCDVKFDSSVVGVGEVCKAVICLEIAATRAHEIFNKDLAIKISGMSEKAYIRSFNSIQHGLGLKTQLDIRELGIQFGCVRLIPTVKRGLLQYKDRFLASLPASRKECADFTRPVFTAVAFYLCAKKQNLKVDRMKLIELCGTSEAEFTSVSNSMQDLCFDIFGIAKEKKDPREIKGNRDLLDALPGKRTIEDGGHFSDDDTELSSYKKRKIADKAAYNEWKSTVLATNNQTKAKAPCKQLKLNFGKDVLKT